MTEDHGQHADASWGGDVPTEPKDRDDIPFREKLALQRQENEDRRFDEHVARERERSSSENALIKSYHHATIRQSWISFSVGLLLGVVGFMFILWTVFAVVRSDQFDKVQQVKLISGIVTAAYSSLLVWQARAAQQRMTEFYDKLRSDRTADVLVELAKLIDDPAMRSRMKSFLALNAATGDNAKLSTDTLAHLLQSSTFLQEMFDARESHAMTLAEIWQESPKFPQDFFDKRDSGPDQQSQKKHQ